MWRAKQDGITAAAVDGGPATSCCPGGSEHNKAALKMASLNGPSTRFSVGTRLGHLANRTTFSTTLQLPESTPRSAVVEWLVFLPVTRKTRVQFPAVAPVWRSLQAFVCSRWAIRPSSW